MTCVAFIPARSGSKRSPNKNIRILEGHPLLAYTISAAIDSNIFDEVICVTDSKLYAKCAEHYGARVPKIRPDSISGDKSPDIEWVNWILQILNKEGKLFDSFSILRPTSPFRKASTIERAWKQFSTSKGVDSIRAVELCSQHPGKMWELVSTSLMQPLLSETNYKQPMHSMQYAALPPIYVQNASLEIAWTKVVAETNTISGKCVAPFFTIEDEGIDINTEFDWFKCQYLIDNQKARLPIIDTNNFNIK